MNIKSFIHKCVPSTELISPIYDMSVYDSFVVEELLGIDLGSIAVEWSRIHWEMLEWIYVGINKFGRCSDPALKTYEGFLLRIIPIAMYHYYEQVKVRREISALTRPAKYGF